MVYIDVSNKGGFILDDCTSLAIMAVDYITWRRVAAICSTQGVHYVTKKGFAKLTRFQTFKYIVFKGLESWGQGGCAHLASLISLSTQGSPKKPNSGRSFPVDIYLSRCRCLAGTCGYQSAPDGSRHFYHPNGFAHAATIFRI